MEKRRKIIMWKREKWNQFFYSYVYEWLKRIGRVKKNVEKTFVARSHHIYQPINWKIIKNNQSLSLHLARIYFSSKPSEILASWYHLYFIFYSIYIYKYLLICCYLTPLNEYQNNICNSISIHFSISPKHKCDCKII